MSTPVNHLGGKCPFIPFFIGGGGADVRGGKCPSLYAERIQNIGHRNNAPVICSPGPLGAAE